MRTTVLFLVIIMFMLMCNIVVYMFNEDYRFFLKKLKHQEEIVYDTSRDISDEDTINIIDSSSSQVLTNENIQTNTNNLNFLDSLSGRNTTQGEEIILPELGDTAQKIIEALN